MEAREPRLGDLRITSDGRMHNSRVEVLTSSGWEKVSGVTSAVITIDAEMPIPTATLKVREIRVDVVAPESGSVVAGVYGRGDNPPECDGSFPQIYWDHEQK